MTSSMEGMIDVTLSAMEAHDPGWQLPSGAQIEPSPHSLLPGVQSAVHSPLPTPQYVPSLQSVVEVQGWPQLSGGDALSQTPADLLGQPASSTKQATTLVRVIMLSMARFIILRWLNARGMPSRGGPPRGGLVHVPERNGGRCGRWAHALGDGAPQLVRRIGVCNPRD